MTEDNPETGSPRRPPRARFGRRRRGSRARAALAATGLLLAALPACERGSEPARAAVELPGESASRRFSAPAEVSIPFHTTVPPGVAAQVLPTDSGSAVRFVATWGDERDERTFLHFAVAREGTNEQVARETVHAVAESYRIPGDREELEPIPPQPWAVLKYPIRSAGTPGEPITGWVALGSHEGRWFHIIVQQPEDLEEEFAPIVDQILNAWEWADGQPLRDPTGLAMSPTGEVR